MFYNIHGEILNEFDYNSDPNQKEFTSIALSPSGQSVVVGSYDSFDLIIVIYIHVICYN